MDVYNERKIPFGLTSDGKLVGVEDVNSGLNCGCVCPCCKLELQANKGGKRTHYFSHNPRTDLIECKSAFETSIHLMAKQILSEEGLILLPSLKISRSADDKFGNTHVEEAYVAQEERKPLTNITMEQCVGEIRPDIMAYEGDQPILIEIAVTHFADVAKKRKIRDLGLDAIEVDLSGLDYTVTKEQLRKIVVESIENKRWLSCPRAKPVIPVVEADLARKVQQKNREYADLLNRNSKRSGARKPRFRPRNHLPKKPVPKATREYNSRWFVCEACRHLFSLLPEHAPDSLKSVECPECGHHASTQSP